MEFQQIGWWPVQMLRSQVVRPWCRCCYPALPPMLPLPPPLLPRRRGLMRSKPAGSASTIASRWPWSRAARWAPSSSLVIQLAAFSWVLFARSYYCSYCQRQMLCLLLLCALLLLLRLLLLLLLLPRRFIQYPGPRSGREVHEVVEHLHLPGGKAHRPRPELRTLGLASNTPRRRPLK